MPTPTSQTAGASKHRSVSYSLALQGGVAIVSIGLALFAFLGLDSWAEASAAHHALQHAIIFLGGTGLGSIIATNPKRSK